MAFRLGKSRIAISPLHLGLCPLALRMRPLEPRCAHPVPAFPLGLLGLAPRDSVRAHSYFIRSHHWAMTALWSPVLSLAWALTG